MSHSGLGIRDWGLGIVLAILLTLPCSSAASAQTPPPELTQPINDFANIIDAETEAEIERRILALKQASDDVVVVATIETFAPYGDIREYAVRMFENGGRGIGAKGKDNGLLVLVAVKDRRVWVEVGYDLEQFITDGLAGEISRTAMTPYFARGEYGAGVLEGATRLIARIAQGRGVTLPGVPQAAPDGGTTTDFGPLVIILIVIIVMWMNNSGGRRSRMRGGNQWGTGTWSGWNSGAGSFGGGGSIGGGSFGGGFGGFGGGRSGGGGGGAGW